MNCSSEALRESSVPTEDTQTVLLALCSLASIAFFINKCGF